MPNQRDKLNLTQPILFLIVIIIVGAGLSWLMSGFHQRRNDHIVTSYTQETNTFIAQNQTGLERLFTQVFPDTLCDNRPELVSCNAVSQSEIMDLISDDLTDFSSTAFIKDSTSSGLLVLSLSGEVSKLYQTDEESLNQLRRLIKGEVSQIEWDYYTRRFGWQTKEVVVPVKNSEGKTIGAITRGVIE